MSPRGPSAVYVAPGGGNGTSVASHVLAVDGATTDITAVIAAAKAAGHDHLIVPEGTWPLTTTLTLSDATLEFRQGARISANLTSRAMSLTNVRLLNADITSTYSSPLDASAATTHPENARAVRLMDGCVVDGYRHEYAAGGLEIVGANVTVDGRLEIANIRQAQGWGAAIHLTGADCRNVKVTASPTITDSDRGIEVEEGVVDAQFASGGYLANIFPNGYTGQPGDYANYTFVLDAHAHEGNGGPVGIIYGGTWRLENCGGAVTFLRSTGTNESDLPRNCRVEEVHIVGRAVSTGAEDLLIQGHGHHIGRVRFSEGDGIAGGTFRVKGGAGSTNNSIGTILADTAAARPTITDTGTGLRYEPLPLPGSVRAGKFLSLPSRPVTTNNALGVGQLRTIPVYIPHRVTLDQLGTEITAAGDAASVVRCGIYTNDNGVPGVPLVDVTVPGNAVAFAMASVSLTLEPGWYHVGGVVQGVTTTQPTLRCCVNQIQDDRFLVFAQAMTATAPLGYSRGGVNGALPAWGTGITISTGNLVPRLWARVTADD